MTDWIFPMPSWFATKGRLFGGERGEPQTFTVQCLCGETLEGTRTKGPQVAVCRRCEQLHFVLPASPFPEPKEKPKRRLLSPGGDPGTIAAGEGADGNRESDDADRDSRATDSRVGGPVLQPPPVPPASPPVALPRVLPGVGPVVPRRVDEGPTTKPRVVGEPTRPVAPRPVEGRGGDAGSVRPPDAAPPHENDVREGRHGGRAEPGGGRRPRRGESKKSLPRQDRSTGRQRESRGEETLRGGRESERNVPAKGPLQPSGSTPRDTAPPHAVPPYPTKPHPTEHSGPPTAPLADKPPHRGTVAGRGGEPASVSEPVGGNLPRGGLPGGSLGTGSLGTEPLGTRSEAPEGRGSGRGEREEWQRVSLVPARRAKWRVRLALLMSLGLAGLGGAWLWNVHADRQAVATFDRELPLAEQAAAQGDLLTAAEHYQPVLEALNRLRRQDPRGLRIRQTARETVATAGLCSTGLTELLSEAIDGETAGVWEAMFRRQYQGQWVVFDVPIRAQRGQAHRYQIDCPVHPAGEAVDVVCDFPELERLNLSETESRRVIFAGQLTACRPPQVATPAWVLELDPRTAFLWVEPVSLQKLGFPAEERLDRVLREQAQVMGLEPTPEGQP